MGRDGHATGMRRRRDRPGRRRTDMRFIFPVMRLPSGDAKRKVRASAAARHPREIEACGPAPESCTGPGAAHCPLLGAPIFERPQRPRGRAPGTDTRRSSVRPRSPCGAIEIGPAKVGPRQSPTRTPASSGTKRGIPADALAKSKTDSLAFLPSLLTANRVISSMIRETRPGHRKIPAVSGGRAFRPDARF